MKIAGIDVHKKVLMVVVVDASTPEEKPERRRFTHKVIEETARHSYWTIVGPWFGARTTLRQGLSRRWK